MVTNHVSDISVPSGFVKPKLNFLPVFVNGAGWYYIGTDNKNYLMSPDFSSLTPIVGFDNMVPLMDNGGKILFSKSGNARYVSKIEGSTVYLSDGDPKIGQPNCPFGYRGCSYKKLGKPYYYKINLANLDRNFNVSYVSQEWSSSNKLMRRFVSSLTNPDFEMVAPETTKLVFSRYAENGDLYLLYASDTL